MHSATRVSPSVPAATIILIVMPQPFCATWNQQRTERGQHATDAQAGTGRFLPLYVGIVPKKCLREPLQDFISTFRVSPPSTQPRAYLDSITFPPSGLAPDPGLLYLRSRMSTGNTRTTHTLPPGVPSHGPCLCRGVPEAVIIISWSVPVPLAQNSHCHPGVILNTQCRARTWYCAHWLGVGTADGGAQTRGGAEKGLPREEMGSIPPK